MSGLKHDARSCRQQAKSEVIRRSHGWLTPDELKAQQEAEEKRRKAQALKDAQGSPLFGGEE